MCPWASAHHAPAKRHTGMPADSPRSSHHVPDACRSSPRCRPASLTAGVHRADARANPCRRKSYSQPPLDIPLRGHQSRSELGGMATNQFPLGWPASQGWWALVSLTGCINCATVEVKCMEVGVKFFRVVDDPGEVADSSTCITFDMRTVPHVNMRTSEHVNMITDERDD